MLRDNDHTGTKNPWDVEKTAKLETMWETHSVAEISAELDLSKGAIKGKAHRLNLPPKESPIPDGPRQPAPAPRYIDPNRRSLPPLSSAEASVNVAPPPVTSASKCQYPIGEIRLYKFCDDPVALGSSYCPTHHDLCHIRLKDPRPRIW